MAMYGMKGLNEIFAGKIPGLPKMEEGDNTSEKVLDNVINRRLNLKEKGNSLKMKSDEFKLKFTVNNENALFAKLKSNTASPTFEKYLKFNNKQGQEEKVWNMIRPRQLGRDMFSRNEVVSPGNEDIIPDTQDVRAQAADIGISYEEPTASERFTQYGQQAADVVDIGLQKGAEALKSGYEYGKEKAGVLKENWQRLRPQKAGMTGDQAIDRLTQMRQKQIRRDILSDPRFLEGIEKQRIQHELNLQSEKEAFNLQLAKDIKRRELGLLPRQTITTGTGKNKKTVLVPYVGEGGEYSQGGMFSSMLPRTAQADWRRYFSQNVPGSEASIGSAISGGALARREESIINATRVGGGSENILYATGRTGGTQQLLSTIRGYDSASTPMGLSGPDKLRWIIASPAQREQMLQLLQQQPVQQMQAPVQQVQSYTEQPVASKAVPVGATYSPYSKKAVTYVRGPYKKTG
jgi:hypothetical protein